jgi:hypothetical protein
MEFYRQQKDLMTTSANKWLTGTLKYWDRCWAFSFFTSCARVYSFFSSIPFQEFQYLMKFPKMKLMLVNAKYLLSTGVKT